ncbi:hypothetical protein [Phosphitispora fastidiosa]|uniref:hypothetical protein n=1 Tax=Phosphitispora fastidiosa TaxID=2837202 RepID=UPI002F42A233|nr:hypothetical protein [Phosphitispora fastidiosa]
METGVDVVAWETSETMGLGEAGSTLKPEMRWVLRRPGDIILDIGYGVEGVKILNLIEGAFESDLKIYVVLNVGRPMTASVDDIVDYVRDLGPVDGLVNNSHLGSETTIDFVQDGSRIVSAAAEILDLPVIATYMDIRFKNEVTGTADYLGNPIRFLTRYMEDAFW